MPLRGSKKLKSEILKKGFHIAIFVKRTNIGPETPQSQQRAKVLAKHIT